MGDDADSTDDETTAPAAGRYHAYHARTHRLQPPAGDGSGQPQDYNRHGEYPHDVLQGPVIGGAEHHPYVLDKSRVEDAPGVHRTDTQVNTQGSRDDQPAIEPGFCYYVLLGQDARHDLPLHYFAKL